MSFAFQPPSIPLARAASLIAVVRYKPTPPGEMGVLAAYQVLPNVVCEDVQVREGADPGAARFRYTLDDSNPDLPWPDGFEDLYPISATGPYIVNNDDRLLVYAFNSQGIGHILFDGFAQIPEVALGAESQTVTFQAIGVACRLWDIPQGGAIYQDADQTIKSNNFQTDLPTRFNPSDDGSSQPNATPGGRDGIDVDFSGTGVGFAPVFLDPTIVRDPDPRRYWTLATAVQYLIWTNNASQTYVQNGNTNSLGFFLQSITPVVAGGTYDPLNPATFTATPIVLREYDASNKPWIEAVEELVSAYGFRVNFVLTTNPDGSPTTTLNFTRRDGGFGGITTSINLQAQGATLNPGLSAVGTLNIARDLQDCWNAVEIETDPVQYELSVVLAPGFPIVATDASDTNKKRFVTAAWTSGATQADKNKYRLFVFDEAGEGHWDFKSSAISNIPGDLSSVLSTDTNGNPPADGKRTNVNRHRPAEQTLFSKGADGRPFKAQLAISRDYSGFAPSVWNGIGHWQPCTGSWEVLQDRLGIRITAEDISKWDIGSFPVPSGSSLLQNSGKAVNVLTSLATPAAVGASGSPTASRFFLRLTCVIDGDQDLGVISPRRPASPTNFAVGRKIDCRDHFKKQVVDPTSPFYATGNINQVFGQFAARDDTPAATSYANAVRSAHELAQIAGSITIPRLALAYQVGMRLSGIVGRRVSFQTNSASGAGEGSEYPTIVAIRYSLGAKHETVLQLSDRRAEPQRA